jgi:hypothetical protein
MGISRVHPLPPIGDKTTNKVILVYIKMKGKSYEKSIKKKEPGP